jgi:hypothetical protein
VGFEILTAKSMKRAVFWFVASCSLYKFADVSEFITVFLIKTMTMALIMQGASTSEMLVYFSQTPLIHSIEHIHLRVRLC